jgi:hypothetical protein
MTFTTMRTRAIREPSGRKLWAAVNICQERVLWGLFEPCKQPRIAAPSNPGSKQIYHNVPPQPAHGDLREARSTPTSPVSMKNIAVDQIDDWSGGGIEG